MRMILGLDTPTNGTALVSGRPYQMLRNPLREACSYAADVIAQRQSRDCPRSALPTWT
jgi:hypothetical protein